MIDNQLQQLADYKICSFPHNQNSSEETMCVYLSEEIFGISRRVPSSQKCNPVIEGLANVEMKRPRDWNAAWRTWKKKKREVPFKKKKQIHPFSKPLFRSNF